MDWLPIETAPHETDALVWGQAWMQWTEDNKDDETKWEAFDIHMAQIYGGQCYAYCGDVTGAASTIRATHWMPLPPPPTSQ